MPVLHSINGKIAKIIVTGHFTIDELLAGFQETLNDGLLTSGTHILVDVTKSEELPSYVVINQIAAVLSDNQNRFSGRMAILVSQTVRYGIARQLSTLLDSNNIDARPFYIYKEAMDWLG